jgi:hypothetical protein
MKLTLRPIGALVMVVMAGLTGKWRGSIRHGSQHPASARGLHEHRDSVVW